MEPGSPWCGAPLTNAVTVPDGRQVLLAASACLLLAGATAACARLSEQELRRGKDALMLSLGGQFRLPRRLLAQLRKVPLEHPHPRVAVVADARPAQAPGVAPAVDDQAFGERVAAGGDDGTEVGHLARLVEAACLRP